MVYDQISAMTRSHRICLYLGLGTEPHAKITHDDMVGCDVDIVVAERDTFSGSCLTEDGQVWILDVQRSCQMDVTAYSERYDTRSLCFNCVSEGSFRTIVSKRCDDIFLASASAEGIFSTTFSAFESDGEVFVFRCPVDVVHRFPLEGSPDERSDSLAVVVDYRLAEIVVEISLAHLLSAKATYCAAVCHRDGSVRVLLDETVDELLVKAFDIISMRVIYIAFSETLQESICEHDRTCGFLIVAFPLGAIEYLVPHSCLRISPLWKHFKEVVELTDQCLVTRMIFRQVVQNFDKGDCIPAGSTTPGMCRKAGLRIAPEHRLRLIPCVAEESCCGIVRIFRTCDKLMDNIGKKRIPLLLRSVSPCILGIERKGHIEAVKPYLVWINLLVPEFT